MGEDRSTKHRDRRMRCQDLPTAAARLKVTAATYLRQLHEGHEIVQQSVGAIAKPLPVLPLQEGEGLGCPRCRRRLLGRHGYYCSLPLCIRVRSARDSLLTSAAVTGELDCVYLPRLRDVRTTSR